MCCLSWFVLSECVYVSRHVLCLQALMCGQISGLLCLWWQSEAFVCSSLPSALLAWCLLSHWLTQPFLSLSPCLSLSIPLSLSSSLCIMCSGGPSLHVAAGWICLQGQPALSAVILTWLFARTTAEITKRSVSPPAPPSLLTQPRSAVNHKRRWLPCSLIESTFPFSSDTA